MPHLSTADSIIFIISPLIRSYEAADAPHLSQYRPHSVIRKILVIYWPTRLCERRDSVGEYEAN